MYLFIIYHDDYANKIMKEPEWLNPHIWNTFCHRNCNINEKDDYQNTPLHVAAINDHAGAVRILLENNADSTERNKADSQPIHNAVSEGNQEYVDVH